jgi:hypothetical protein
MGKEENDHTLTSGQITRFKPLGCNDSDYNEETHRYIVIFHCDNPRMAYAAEMNWVPNFPKTACY